MPQGKAGFAPGRLAFIVLQILKSALDRGRAIMALSPGRATG
ncbi:hypothetical protein ROS217_04994 [Roseovarius sp. 217]|nr:hypothetical protein ROS217_04994 [Roseovarius sp. 217]